MDESRWGQVSALLDELFELDDAAREERLARLSREDAELAAELRRLLAADQRSGVLDVNALAGSGSLGLRLAGADPPFAGSGLQLGHYRLVERVGSGGMGEVWRAQREDDFEQQVAVKLIRPLVDSVDLRQRFARERQILARLDHPGIARLLDGGVAEDGTPWYAMEYVRGSALVAHANQHQLDLRARVQLMVQVCDAVAHAHAQLVVHRDLKPSNILVDGEGRVRVLDFGIARLLDDSLDSRLTSTGVRVFSPAYAAPEQIRGEVAGTHADVFALGAVLFELLTDEPPYPRRSASPERLLAELAEEVTPRPSDTLRRQQRSVPRVTGGLKIDDELDVIVAAALQPDPARRYQGALQLGEDLRRWLDGRPIAARPDSAAYRTRKFVARHRMVVASMAAVLVALLGGLGLALWQADLARAQAERADTEAARAAGEAARAEREAAEALEQAARTRRVKSFFVEAFLHADPMRRDTDSPATVAEALDAAIARAGSELDDDPSLQAAVLDDFGEIRAGQGRLDEAQALIERALAAARRAYGGVHPMVAESLLNLGVIQGMRGDPLSGKAYVEQAVAILEKDDGGQPTDLANALSALGRVRQVEGDAAGVRDAMERAVVIFRKHAPDDPQYLAAQTNLAMVAKSEGRNSEAETVFRDVLRQVEAKQGDKSPHLWPNLVALAGLAYVRGDHAEELALSRRALQVARHNYPGDHLWVAYSLSDVGWMLARGGDLAEGEGLMRESIAMNRRLGPVQAVSAMRRLAVALRRAGRTEDSRQVFDSVWDLCQRNGMQAQQICVVIRANRAQMLAYAGEAETALAEADAAVAALQTLDGDLVSEKGQADQAKAAALAALGRTDEALALQDAVIASYTERFGQSHEETASALSARSLLIPSR